jgi:hypothetical protein
MPEQSAFVAHWAHCPSWVPLVRQMGSSVAATHSALDPHARHVSMPAPDLLQMGVVVFGEPSHSAVVTHATHAPASGSPAGAHHGVPPPHWALLVHAPQVCVVALQIGVWPPQSVFVRHCTHVPGGFSQRGVVPPHWASVVHVHSLRPCRLRIHMSSTCSSDEPPVDPVKPKYAPAPTVENTFTVVAVTSGSAGLEPVFETNTWRVVVAAV